MENLILLRKKNGVLQKDIAAYLNVSQQTYCNYEKGVTQPSLAILSRMADFFGVSVDFLIGHDTNGETVPEYARLYNALSDYHKGIALAYMRGLLAAEGKEIDPIKNSVILQK